MRAFNVGSMAARALAAVGLCAAGASAQGPSTGADIIHSNIQDVANYGAVGGTAAFAIGSWTCNIGNASLSWQSRGTPALGMNAYRLHNGRLTQIGMGFVKYGCCVANGSGCPHPTTGATLPCSTSGFGLRPGCRDVYSGGFNGGHSWLGPRSAVNPWTGVMTSNASVSGDAIWRRVQVATSDLNVAGALYYFEGVYVCTEESAAGTPASNKHNNASYRRFTTSGTNATMADTTQISVPAIKAWRANGLGLNQPDARVEDAVIDIPGEGRFHMAHKVTDLGNGRWLYDYAIFNLNSDIAANGFRVPVPAGVTVSNVGYNDPTWHSGEVWSNTPLAYSRTATEARWDGVPFATNANANAIRWGTMFNFWFEATTAPTPGTVTLALFKNGGTMPINGIRVPGNPPCRVDFNGDGFADFNDYLEFLNLYNTNNLLADLNGDGIVDFNDYLEFLNLYNIGC